MGRVTVRWNTKSQSGRMPGRFTSVYDAECAAKSFMLRFPSVIVCRIYHDTGGWVRDVQPVLSPTT